MMQQCCHAAPMAMRQILLEPLCHEYFGGDWAKKTPVAKVQRHAVFRRCPVNGLTDIENTFWVLKSVRIALNRNGDA